ncbi:HNH endonuclease signature motif containing protein [Anaeromicropila populeti]|uniref:HNH endonuclease n=1 Tax=Anaeromicropila populeti TaxID=37658 RepID=A0A1I6K8T0_9FIRM|nr:HNH endonuclease [Anaeromicropila populeti]SFR87673.1 HNH endonuclease [Anaeromicropila populeti]
MRPVNKGKSPYTSIGDYHDAEPFLGSTIGYFCSYCEFPIIHVPEVEHKESKNSGGALTDWDNLLFGCKYCNARKKEKVKKGEHDKWIWF